MDNTSTFRCAIGFGEDTVVLRTLVPDALQNDRVVVAATGVKQIQDCLRALARRGWVVSTADPHIERVKHNVIAWYYLRITMVMPHGMATTVKVWPPKADHLMYRESARQLRIEVVATISEMWLAMYPPGAPEEAADVRNILNLSEDMISIVRQYYQHLSWQVTPPYQSMPDHPVSSVSRNLTGSATRTTFDADEGSTTSTALRTFAAWFTKR